MTQIWVFLKHYSELKRREEMAQSLGNKEFWKEYFVSTMLGDKKNRDSFYAHIVIKETVEKFHRDRLQASKDEFTFQATRTLNKYVEHRRLIQELDEKIFNSAETNPCEVFDYIVKPRSVIKTHFERKLKEFTVGHLHSAKDYFR